jgi:hypothetical protein
MKPKQLPLALALALAVAGLAACNQQLPEADRPVADVAAETTAADAAPVDAHADATTDAHAAAAGGTDYPVPADHVRWTPDAPLAEGMSRVRTALAGLEAESHPDDATVQARAADIDAAIAYMFANCKLPTEADVALHAMLARLMADTEALKADPSDGAAVADMHQALHNYEALFDDPAAA